MKYKSSHYSQRIAAAALTAAALTAAALTAPLAAEVPAKVVGGAWRAEGPGPNTQGQVENIVPNDEVVGAVQTVVAHPTDADVLWVGAVNGGVWRTDDASAQSPDWVHQTDAFPSLSIGALDLDPTDAGFATLVAGLGRNSSFGRRGGSLAGLLRTTDGGASWTLLDGGGSLVGKNVSGVAARGATIVVAARRRPGEEDPGPDTGVFRSADGGASFVQVSTGNGSATGLPAGVAFDLVGDPLNASRLFAPISLAEAAGGQSGVYRSDDTGANWVKVSSAAMDNLLDNANISNAEIAVGRSNNVYVAIATNGRLSGVFRSGNGGGTWNAMDVPAAHPGGQASIHLSIVADPADPDLVYIGGDRQSLGDFGAQDFSGRLFRGDASAPSGSQFVHLTHSRSQGPAGGGTLSSSAPHADSRELTFDAAGNLVETDDGGIYRRTLPASELGDWFSLNGNLQTTELHDAAFDANSDVVIGGAQDTGTPEQIAPGGLVWRSVATADGGDVAVDDDSMPGFSVRYSSNQFLGAFRRRTYDAGNNLVAQESPSLIVLGGGGIGAQFSTPVVLNNVDPTRMIIGGADVFESLDQGDTLIRLSPSVTVNGTGLAPIAYGSAGNPDVLYVGSEDEVWVRTAADPAPLVRSTAFPGSGSGRLVSDIAVDLDDPATAFAVDSERVYHTQSTGQSWIDVTGNLPALDPGAFHALEIIADPAGAAVVVGADRGVFVARAGSGFAVWDRLGTGLANAPVFDLDYDAGLDKLVAGTLGRGAWSLSPTLGPPSVSITQPAAGAVVRAGESVVFAATAVDADDGDLSAGLAWSSSLDGTIGSGASFSTSALTTGTHTVTASVTDSDGATGSDSVVLTVIPANCSVGVTFEGGAGGWSNSPASTCSTGAFVLGTPTEVTDGGVVTQPDGDHTLGSGNAFFSAFNTAAGTDDVDGGTCVVESPVFPVAAASEVSIWYFHGQRDAADDGGDFFQLEVSTDGGVSYTSMVAIGDVTTNAVWTEATASVPAGSDVRFRVQVADGPAGGDLIEAGVDDLLVCATGGGNTAPAVTVTSPADGSTFTEGQSITFTGTAVDNEDGDLSANLSWTSSVDGPIGSGASFTTSALSAGGHIVTASVTDSGGLPGSDAISVTVEAAGGCALEEDFEGGAGGWTNSPASTCSTGSFVIGTPTQVVDGGVVTQLAGDHTTGAGNAFFSAVNTSAGADDVDGGTCVVLSPVVAVGEASDVSIWYYHGQRDAGDDPAGDFFLLEVSTDGGATFSPLVSIGDVTSNAVWTEATASVPAGSNVQLRLQVADGAGPGDLVEAGLDDVSICPAAGGNTAPAVAITQPPDGTTVTEGDAVTFTGTASDAEDGDLTANLAWTSSLDGAIGSGGSFTTSSLSAGVHTITASVTDSGGLPGSDSIGLTVLPAAGCTVEDDFEGGAGGWTNSPASTCSTGSFVLGTPTAVANGGVTTQPAGDHTTGAGNAIFTAVNTAAGTDDVDGGNCVLESPVFAVGASSTLSIWYFHGQRDAGDDAAGDFFRLEVSTDGGASFTPFVSIGDVTSNAVWTEATASVPAGSDVQVRVQVSDGTPAGDLVEGGIDDFSICAN